MFNNLTDLLYEDPQSAALLTKHTPIIAFRRPRNLKDILVHANIAKVKPRPPGNFKCGKNCINCSRMLVSTDVTSPINGYSHHLKHYFDCKSTFVIYCIICAKCSKLYIGQTSNSLASRMTAHIADIRNNKPNKIPTTVAKHFRLANHSIQDVKVTALIHASRHVNTRMRQEEAFMKLFVTCIPRGLNIMTQ